MMLTLPTPEIPTSPLFALQPAFSDPENPPVNSSCSGYTHNASNRSLDVNQEFKVADVQEPSVMCRKSNTNYLANIRISTELLNVPARNTKGLGIGISDKVVTADEELVSNRPLLDNLAKQPSESSANPDRTDEDLYVPLGKSRVKTRKHLLFWHKFRQFVKIHLRRRLSSSGSLPDADIPVPRSCSEGPCS
jgi:hypothetical protein